MQTDLGHVCCNRRRKHQSEDGVNMWPHPTTNVYSLASCCRLVMSSFRAKPGETWPASPSLRPPRLARRGEPYHVYLKQHQYDCHIILLNMTQLPVYSLNSAETLSISTLLYSSEKTAWLVCQSPAKYGKLINTKHTHTEAPRRSLSLTHTVCLCLFPLILNALSFSLQRSSLYFPSSLPFSFPVTTSLSSPSSFPSFSPLSIHLKKKIA